MPFRLFANCVAVRGARRALICDLQRIRHFPVPLTLVDVLERHRNDGEEETFAAYSGAEREIVREYLDFLVENELGWWCDDPERFPPMDLSWEYPGLISNALVDTGEASAHDYPSIFRQLDELGCKSVQLRFFAPVALERLDEILAATGRGGLRAIELVIPFSAETTDEALGALIMRHQRVLSVYCHSAPERRLGVAPYDAATIAYHTERVVSASHCGQVHPAYFMASLPLFTESQKHNSCLNRKVSVDERGEIRNCPSMPAGYGNAREVSLRSAVVKAQFQDIWEVNKDRIDVCSDCEFRYVCTDCRAFTRDPDDRFSKPSKCTYDPYTASWAAPPAPGQLRITIASPGAEALAVGAAR